MRDCKSLHISTRPLDASRHQAVLNSSKNKFSGRTLLFTIATLMGTPTYALNPSQQAVMDYFTDPSVCTFNAGVPVPPPIDDPEKDKGEKLSIANSSSHVSTSEIVGGGSYDCSNLRSAEGEIHFQAGIERLLNNPQTLDLPLVLQGLAFEEVITMGTLNIEVNGAHMANLMAHVDGLHQGSFGMRYPSVDGSGSKPNVQRGGGASAGGSAEKIGFFVNTRVDTGEKDVSSRETGFDFDAHGITAGVDMRLSKNAVIGFALGYGNTEADYTSSTGEMDMDGYSASVFGTLFKKDRYYADAILNYTRNTFDSTRTFVTPNNVTQTAVSSTDGDVLTLGLGAGYQLNDKDVSYGNFVRVNYTRVSIDAFEESGAGPVGMQIDKQELTSLEGVVGFQASKVMSQSWGVFIPQFRLELVHEFDNDSRIVNARFLGVVDNGIPTTLLLPTDEPDRSYINLGLGASAQFGHGRSGFVQYTGLFAQDDIDEHALELGLRWNY